MSFYFQPQGNWVALNREAAFLFGTSSSSSTVSSEIRVYANAAHALLEFTLGFREQFPMRKKFYYFKDLDPHFALAATTLAKAGLQVTALDYSTFCATTGEVAVQKIHELVAGFDREFGFIFYPVDNPVTGEIYTFEELDKSLSEKSFARLRSSYGYHRSHGLKSSFERSEAVVYAFSELALLASGDRMRFGSPVVAALSPVSKEDLQNAHKMFRVEGQGRVVKDFENKNLADSTPYFSDGSKRLYDRAVVYWPDMDGHAFINELANQLDEPLKSPGQDWRFETTSLSRWGGIRTMDWLKSHGLTSEQIRGLVTIDARLLTPEFEEKFARSREAVLEMQSGSN